MKIDLEKDGKNTSWKTKAFLLEKHKPYEIISSSLAWFDSQAKVVFNNCHNR